MILRISYLLFASFTFSLQSTEMCIFVNNLAMQILSNLSTHYCIKPVDILSPNAFFPLHTGTFSAFFCIFKSPCVVLLLSLLLCFQQYNPFPSQLLLNVCQQLRHLRRSLTSVGTDCSTEPVVNKAAFLLRKRQRRLPSISAAVLFISFFLR